MDPMTQNDPQARGSLGCDMPVRTGMDRRRGGARLIGRLDTAKAAAQAHAECIDSSAVWPAHLHGYHDLHPLAGRTHRQMRKAAQKVRECSSWLTLRDYFELGTYEVEAARCRQHLICPTCAIFRGARVMAAAVERIAAARRQCGFFRFYLLTLTLKPSADLRTQLDLLTGSWRKMQTNRKPRGRWRGNELNRLLGGIRSIEVKRGAGSGLWHTHMHSLVLADHELPVVQDAGGAWRWPLLSEQWKHATGGSFIVECHPITASLSADVRDDVGSSGALGDFITSDSGMADLVGAVCEVSKYAVKLNELDPQDLLTAWGVCSGRRLLHPFGCLHGIDRAVEREAADDLDLMKACHAFIEHDFRYRRGVGYTVTQSRVDPGSIPF